MTQNEPDINNQTGDSTEALTYESAERAVLDLVPNAATALKLILAVAVSSQFDTPLLLWIFLVGVPSSGKTEIVQLLKDSSVTYSLDTLTQNAFISGARNSDKEPVYDLLPLLDKKCLVVKDWTSIFSLDEKMTRKLLGDLVGIYDKEFSKFSSQRGNINYESSFSHIGCITPATLNNHSRYMNMVGPRFLCYSMPGNTAEQEVESYERIFAGVNRSTYKDAAKKIVSEYLNQLATKELCIEPLSEECKKFLRIAAKFMAHCRGIVILQPASFKDENRQVKYYETLSVQIEEPWRAVQQLMILAKLLAFVIGKNAVEYEELAIIKDVVIASMPADRSQALKALQEYEGEMVARQLTETSDTSDRTSRRLLSELVALKVVEKIAGSGTTPHTFKIVSEFSDFLLLSPSDFLSNNDSRTKSPRSEPIRQSSKNDRIQHLLNQLNKAHKSFQSNQSNEKGRNELWRRCEPYILELEKLGIDRMIAETVVIMGTDVDYLIEQLPTQD